MRKIPTLPHLRGSVVPEAKVLPAHAEDHLAPLSVSPAGIHRILTRIIVIIIIIIITIILIIIMIIIIIIITITARETVRMRNEVLRNPSERMFKG